MPHSLYLHIPFCTHRCAYCDFNTYAGQADYMSAYVEALCREVAQVGGKAPSDLVLHTVFFGGGTPSMLSASQVKAILTSIRAAFDVVKDAEITLEANPGTLSLQQLEAMRQLGINRLSLGVQSANGFELRQLEREHSFLDVLQSVSAARRAGFHNLNLDLIYGLPEQTLASWQTTVSRVMDLQPEHISAYALTLEHGTPFGRWHARGLLTNPDPDLAADMYEWLHDELDAAGFAQYEISNWARPGHACMHNLQYWRGLPYLGLGAGAHGYAGGYRYSNVLGIDQFIRRFTNSTGEASHSDEGALMPGIGGKQPVREFPFSEATVNRHHQTELDDMSEFMMTGLRLTREGVSKTAFKRRFGRDLSDQYPVELAELTALGLLEWAQVPLSTRGTGDGTAGAQVVRLTARGRLLGNQVFMRFVN